MKFTVAMLAGLAAFGIAGAAAAADNGNCNVVHLKAGESPPNGMSTSISAGNGAVSGHTTVGTGGNGVSVSSGSGGASVSSGSGSAASSMSTSSNGKTTTVTTSDGNCTVYIHDK